MSSHLALGRLFMGCAVQASRGTPTKLVAVPGSGLWTCSQVASYLNVSESWVWKQVREDLGLPYIRLGSRNVRFDPAAVKAWVQSQVHGRPAAP